MRSSVATCFLFTPVHHFAVPQAVFLLANFAFAIFLGCLCSHPLLNGMIVWADADSPAFDVKAAKKGRKVIADRKYKCT